jgi:hypothetical protein
LAVAFSSGKPVATFPENAPVVQTVDSRKLLAELRDASLASAAVRAEKSKDWTPLFVVASPRPLTGKTFLARLFVDFLRLDGKAIRAFDINPVEGSLAQHAPVVTSRIDIANTPGQVALFDRLILEDGIPKVVDLGSPSFERFFQLLDEIGFLQEVGRRAVAPILLYPADLHPSTAQAYYRLRKHLPDMLIVPVFNEAIAKGRQLREQFTVVRAAAVPLQIPILPPALKPYADRPHSFSDFHSQQRPEIPPDRAVELRAWTRRVFLELREFELRLLLEKLRASIKF